MKRVRMHSDSSNFPRKKNSFHQQKREREKKKINHHHTEQQKTLVCFCRQSLSDKVCFGSRAPEAAATTAQRFKGDGFNPGVFTRRTVKDHPGEDPKHLKCVSTRGLCCLWYKTNCNNNHANKYLRGQQGGSVVCLTERNKSTEQRTVLQIQKRK